MYHDPPSYPEPGLCGRSDATKLQINPIIRKKIPKKIFHPPPDSINQNCPVRDK